MIKIWSEKELFNCEKRKDGYCKSFSYSGPAKVSASSFRKYRAKTDWNFLYYEGKQSGESSCSIIYTERIINTNAFNFCSSLWDRRRFLGTLELRDYLGKGWMVASPADFNNKYNGQLTDDDLVFNNAALHTIRTFPEVDKKQIALVGGSAGGYMTFLMY